MSTPVPPEDDGLRNIIDKLATFVARNGPEFESMTRDKQAGNPKFDFLNGGLYHDYYNFVLNTEQYVQQQNNTSQTMLPIQGMVPQPRIPLDNMQGAHMQDNQGIQAPHSGQLQQLIIQRQEAMDQITTSEQNLRAQYTSIQQQKQINIDQALLAAQEEKLVAMSNDCGLNLAEFDQVLQPVIDNCSKDSILNGKNFILGQVHNYEQAITIAEHLQHRIVTPYTSYDTRLHLIYLINDILHHCTKRGVDSLKKALQAIVISIFTITHSEVTADKQIKLLKLLNLWDKNKYFPPEIIQCMRDASTAAKTYKNQVLNDYASLIEETNTNTNNQYQAMEKQHLEFVNHLSANIGMIDQKITACKLEAAQSIPPLVQNFPDGSKPNANDHEQTNQFDYNHGEPLPDMSQPPPGYNANDMDLKPKLPYFALPSALMVPLIEIQESYKPIDADDIRLPAPAPPSERVLQAVENFYNPPSREQPRDEDGWETMGLFEFTKFKKNAIREVRISNGLASQSESSSEGDEELSFSIAMADVEESSDEMESLRLLEVNSDDMDDDNAASTSLQADGSTAPPGGEADGARAGKGRISRKERSKLLNEQRKQRYESESPESGSPRRRATRKKDSPKISQLSSSTSPKFMAASPETTDQSDNESLKGGFELIPDVMLGDGNKGHQLLKKMGWQGQGLGHDGQGIVDPVRPSEIRQKDEKYIGIGQEDKDDQYNSFRKNRSSNYSSRILKGNKKRK